MRRSAPLALALAVALIPSAILVWQYRDMPHLGFFHDDSIYWVCARSLAEGNGYRIASLPGEPFETKYPPLFPWLLSWIWRIEPRFPQNLPLAALAMWLMLPPAVVLSYRLLRDCGLEWRSRLGIAALAAVNPYFLIASVSLLSELPFCCLVFGSLILAARAGGERGGSRDALVAGMLGGAAFLTRNLALPLLVTAPACLLWKGKRKQAALFAAGMLPAVAGWMLWERTHLAAHADSTLLYYTSYFGYHRHIVSPATQLLLLWKNLDFLLASIGNLFVFGLSGTPWGTTIARLIAVAAASGIVRMLRNGAGWQLASYGVCMLAMLLPWHYPPTERLVLPAFPLLAAGLAMEISHLTALLSRALAGPRAADSWIARAALAGLGALAMAAVATTFQADSHDVPGLLARNRAALGENLSVYRWVKRELPAGTRVAAYRDAVLYLYTGRHACRPQISPVSFYRGDRAGQLGPVHELPAFARTRGLSYLLSGSADFEAEMGEVERSEAGRIIASSPELEPAFRTPAVTLYRVKGGA